MRWVPWLASVGALLLASAGATANAGTSATATASANSVTSADAGRAADDWDTTRAYGAVRDIDDKATLHADLETKQVRVETTASDEAVAEAIREAGFTVEAAA